MHPVVPASPLQRALKALGSLLLLIGLIGGLPVALVLFAGNPLPDQVPSLDTIQTELTSPDDGSLFMSVLAIVGWLAWASFTGSVLLELFARMFRRRPPSIPGLRGPQRIASILVAAVAAIAITPTVASASAAVVDAPPAVSAPLDPVVDSGFGQRTTTQGTDTILHLVERGEGLLDLQEKYGVPWQRIAEANYGAEQPDGRTLERGQTRIYAGWQLRIPISAGSTEIGAAPPVISGFGAAQPQPDRGTDRPAQQPVYRVEQGDWMWHIAERYLGDPERYTEIAALNPEYADQHGDFPDHIEAGWTLTLPEDAVDRGPIEHATGTATTPEAPPEQTQPAPPDGPGEQVEPGDQDGAGSRTGPGGDAGGGTGPGGGAPGGEVEPGAGAGLPEAAPAPQASGFGPGPEATRPAATQPGGQAHATPAPATQPAADQADGFSAFEPDLERLAPAALASAGLLTALVLGAAGFHQHRRHQHHRPGFRFASPAAWRLEKTLRSAQQPLDTARLDAALRALAAGLAQRGDPLPDIAGALVEHGAVHMLLAQPCPNPPAPWQDRGDRWTLPAGVVPPVPAGEASLAPLPTLAAIGSQAGIHLLLDLERLGFLTVYGDPGRAMDLLRYLAAELACNSWSDSAQVLLAGFQSDEAQLLVALNAGRVQAVPSIPEAVAMVRQRIASARATLEHTGAGDALAGRVRGIAGDAWMPQILLAAAASPADLAALAELEQELDGAARCAVAVATMETTPPPPDKWRVTVTADGVVHLRLPFLRASLAAAALSVEELAPLAETMQAARAANQVPVPPAPEPEPWATGTDAAGSLQLLGRLTAAPWLPQDSGQASASAPPSRSDLDPNLDQDLRDWYTGGNRPRIGILGPVALDAPGTPPETRRRLHAELIVFLAQRAGRGAEPELIDAALWPDVHVTDAGRQRVISRVRQWLGTRTDGTPWLPDIGPDLKYRLADGYLFDWHLFRRLRTRAESRGPDGIDDLRAALQLIRGAPLAGADRPHAPGTRNPYPWLAESDIYPGHLVSAIVDTAHQLAERCLAAGDLAGVRWAVQQAWLADVERSYDQPWQDLLRAEHADGQTDRLRSVLAELMQLREAESPEDLSPDTFSLISAWPPNVLVPAGQAAAAG
ncbi:MAG TPA: LysM peptidoglycan-binding domain-containing protein [Natronosporangium sp.]